MDSLCGKTVAILNQGEDRPMSKGHRVTDASVDPNAETRIPADSTGQGQVDPYETIPHTTDPTTTLLRLPDEIARQNRYKILSEIGRGGMGQVYLAEHLLTKRKVALKTIRSDVADDAAVVERFLREVRAAALLDHPHIVRVYDAEQFGNVLGMSMEFIQGDNLHHLVLRTGPLDVKSACRYTKQTAEGLCHAHSAGIIHRDIKPMNLLLDRSEETEVVKIADFGLARILEDSVPSVYGTPTGFAMGTIGYMAPEQSRDARTAGIHADIFSLGRTLYFLLTGQLPYDHTSKDWQKMVRGEADVVPLSQLRPDLPKGIITIVERMTARSLDSRYQNCECVIDALSEFRNAPSHRRTWWRFW